MNPETIKNIKIQNVRFNGLARIFNEIEEITFQNENNKLTPAWSKIKAQAINKYWEWVLITHEDVAVLEMPETYATTKSKFDKDVEEMLILLQESIETDTGKEELKLPRIEITNFQDDYFQWVNFRDLFKSRESTVIGNKKLSDAQKMHFLRTNLEEYFLR